MTSSEFIKQLSALASPGEAEKRAGHFQGDDPGTRFLGVRMGDVFKLAKAFRDMPLKDINALFDSDYYEVRMGAVSIMDFQARAKPISEADHKALYDLYLRRHDRLNNWDFPDRAAPHVIGRYLLDRPRDPLYELAQSKNVWERRTALLATAYFLRQGETEETFAIAAMLLEDKYELTHRAVGSWLREAGKTDEQGLRNFLDKHKEKMPRTSLRMATEKLPKEVRQRYLENT